MRRTLPVESRAARAPRERVAGLPGGTRGLAAGGVDLGKGGKSLLESSSEGPQLSPRNGRVLGGLGWRSICPLGGKVVPYNTEGRFQLDKPGPAIVRRRRVVGWGTARKAGDSGEPGTGGEGCGVAQARLAGAVVVGWGRWGRRVPASPGTAAWTQTACCWCVSVSILCPPVHDMLKCSPVPIPGTPITRRLCICTGEWAVLCCAPLRGRKLCVFATLRGYLCAGALQRQRENCGEGSGRCWGHWPGGGRGPPPAGLHNLFSVCLSLSLFFPLALSVSSLLIRSPNPPAFSVEKPDTQVSGASGAVRINSVFCTHLAHLGGVEDGGRRRKKTTTHLTCCRQVWIPNHAGPLPGAGWAWLWLKNMKSFLS